jgi:dUTP pyrophosphatase
MQKLLIVKMFDDVKLPERKNPTDSGFDLFAYSFKRYYQNHGSNSERMLEGKNLEPFIRESTVELGYLDRILVGTGIKATVGAGFEIQVRPRSGLALKQGLSICNTPGTIDEAYRDEIGLIIVNLSRKVQSLTLGDRVAQMVVCPVALPEIEVVQSLPENDRGGGFGSTGVK